MQRNPALSMIVFTIMLLSGAFLPAPALCLSPGEHCAHAAEQADPSGQQYSVSPTASGSSSSVCYEVFVRSFYDSNADGIGDLKGLMQSLDYINDGDRFSDTDLDCDMLWLMPVFPSPTYHKYDVTDYCAIDPSYGSMEDFDQLLSRCHERSVRVILDLPLNHTSTSHPWFIQASDYLRSLAAGEVPSGEACPYVDYYHFSDAPADGSVPLEGSDWYYEARFWSGMPDLDLDNPAVRDEIESILRFWLEKGVDGFRLDAVTSYYTDNEQANIAFLSWLNAAVKDIRPEAYLVGEAWTSVQTYARYYASGIDSLFDFSFAGQEGVIAGIARGTAPASRYGERLMEEEALFAEYSASAVNAPFYTNHDMARSAGYYARDGEPRVKLAQVLNLLMPGQAFLYYGEELGMKGSGKDENKRAPMYWTDDPSASCLCDGPPDMDEVKMKYPSWEEQSGDPFSILSYVKQAIRLRRNYPAIAKGCTQMIEPLSGKEVCTLLRTADDTEPVLLVINTSDTAQTVDLSAGGGEASHYTQLAAQLHVSQNASFLMAPPAGGILTLPPFGIAVLTQANAGRLTDSLCILD